MKRVISATSKKPEYYISIYKLNGLIQGEVKSSKHSESGWVQGGLLNLYSKYMNANIDVARQRGKDSSYGMADSYMQDLKRYETGIRTLCARLADEIEKIEKEL